jgi:peptidoglycan glycosyltransferase
MMTPRLVSEIRSREGEVIVRIEPRPWKQAISGGVAADVREAMVVSASEGYARAGAPAGIAIGGKTGSAQLGGNSEPHAWYMAFAPADDPQLVVIVLVERGGLGGDVAAPIARELISTALAQ